MAIRSQVAGCGAYLPSKVVTNEDLAEKIETSDDWIQQRTGIRQRHVAAEGEMTSHLGLHAARAALEQAGFDQVDEIARLRTWTWWSAPRRPRTRLFPPRRPVSSPAWA